MFYSASTSILCVDRSSIFFTLAYSTIILGPRMRSRFANEIYSLVVRASAPVATVLDSIPASVGTVESEGRQMKQC
jgi:hypothetical protein